MLQPSEVHQRPDAETLSMRERREVQLPLL
jgi:hypothetical protein